VAVGLNDRVFDEYVTKEEGDWDTVMVMPCPSSSYIAGRLYGVTWLR
jgi:hypothetical protein